jgi:pimeloyl-ACP methyl ester carboxylesterase
MQFRRPGFLAYPANLNPGSIQRPASTYSGRANNWREIARVAPRSPPCNVRVRSKQQRCLICSVLTESDELIRRAFHSFEWRGHQINYRVEGPVEGPPVLLLHGFGASVQHWRKTWPALEDSGCRVFVLDLLGFGASSKPNLGIGGYCLELWRDLCIDFIHEFGTRDAQFVLVGNSIGSLVSLMTAVALPDRIRGLCLIACAGGMVPFRRSELNPISSSLVWFMNTLLFNKITGPVLFRKFRTKENVLSVVSQAYAGSAHVVDDVLAVRNFRLFN